MRTCLFLTVLFGAAAIVYFNRHAAKEPPAPVATAPTPIHSMAVLPLDNISNNTKDDFLSIGLADALVTKLQQIPSLQVRPTSAIVDWCAQSPAEEFIIMTESGVRYSLERAAPHKKFHFVANEQCNCSECPYMKLNTLEKLRDALENLEPRVEIPADIIARARLPIERMLAVKSSHK